jgi:DNA-binding MarR family transcriptional regulator
VSLSTLLSQALIAFTIEFDNEAERQFAESGLRRLYPVSLVMWSNYLRFIEPDGVPVRELREKAGVSENHLASRLGALQRWGYVTVAAESAAGEPLPSRRDWTVRLTGLGRKARAVWLPLVRIVETRWEARFGRDPIEKLRQRLRRMTADFEPGLPHYLPVVGYDMFAALPPVPATAREAESDAVRDLPALLSAVLLALTIECERESELSMPMGSNALRVLGETAVRVRDLPSLTGVSKEAISVAIGFLEKRGYLTIEPDASGSRSKVVRLTRRGERAQDAYRRHLGAIEEGWHARFGPDEIRALVASLQGLFDARDGDGPRVSQGLVPYPGGWRLRAPYAKQTAAILRDPSAALPHYPMVLHRGGWPDGS